MAKNTSQSYILSGRITDQQNQPLEGVIVLAFDQDPKTPANLLGQATTTDAEGKYTISFTEKDFKVGGVESGGPDVFIRVYEGEELMGESPVKRNSKKTIKIDLKVKYERQDPNEPWRRVYGVVRNAIGELMTGMTVLVFDRDLRTEQLLGRTATEAGKYEVRYRSAQFKKAEKEAADIVVKVWDAAGKEVHKTAVFFNAPNELEVNINLDGVEYKGPSEWEVLTDTLMPLLEGVSPLGLREDEQFQDVSFLAGETGKNQVLIGTWIACHHLADKTTREKTPLEAALFFGFMRQGQPALLYDTLLQDIQHPERAELLKDKLLRYVSSISPELKKQLIEKALNDNLIPARIRANIEEICEILRQIKLHYIAENTFGAGKGTINQLLQLTPKAAKEQAKFMAAFADHKGSMDIFWKKLETDKIFQPSVIRDVKLSFELGALTWNHIPLVAALNQKFKTGEVEGKRELAKLDRQGWIEIFKSKGSDGKVVGVPANMDGTNQEENYQQFAVILEESMERAYPTTAFAAKLARNENSPIAAKTELVRFLDNNPIFHLDRYRIDHYIAENADALKDIEDKESVVQQLKSVQRVFKLSPKHQTVDVLLGQKIESAQQVYFMGKERFVASLKGTGINKIESKKIYQRAENAYAMTLTLFGNYNNTVNGVIPFGATQQVMSAEDAAKIKALPNLQTLFGSLDYCECTHCRSVYSPAAHYVDILRFLKERNTNGKTTHAGKNVKDVLLERRPDLGEIELSCENTNTPLPYIDLVNELLEDVVSPPVPSTLSSSIESDLIAGPIKSDVSDELAENGYIISSDAEVYAQDSRSQWAIRDKQNAYKLFKQGANLRILPTKQTHWTAAELRANPEYTNAQAYDKLSAEVFPFNLPFNLWHIQTRSYLSHSSVAQPRLFELFQQTLADGITHTPNELQINSAYLSLNETERKIITGTLPGKQSWDFWGLTETGNNLFHPETPTDPSTNVTGTWIQVLSQVSVMLHRTGLTYKELLQLLDMTFVNPAGSIFINDNADSNAANCDTTKFQIIGLTQTALDRMHRFIRLWRRLGCAMWELDMLLPDTNPAPGITDKQLTDAVLQDISCMNRIREKFGWDWRVTLALFNNIDYAIYLDRSKSDAPAIQTLYQRLFRNKLVDATAVFPESPDLIAGPIEGNAAALPPVADKIPGILAAFRIKESDLILILDDLSLTPASTLDWTVLSRIYRITLLAKALGLSMNQFIRLKRLAGTNPYLNPKATLDFIELAETLSASGFSVVELDYLLSHHYTANSGIVLEDKSITAYITALREGLQKVTDDLTIKTEETKDAYIKSKLGLLPALSKDAEQVQALAIIEGTWTGAPMDRNALIDKYFVGVLDLTVAKTNLAALPPSGTGMALEARYGYFQPELQAYLLQTQKEVFLKQKVAEFFQIEVPNADLLLTRLQLSGAATTLLQHLNNAQLLLKPSGVYQFSIIETNFPNMYAALRLLHKNAMIARKLKIKPNELDWWLTGTHATDMGWPQAGAFPLDTTTTVPIATWFNFSGFFAWKNTLPKSEQTAFEWLDLVLDAGISATDTITALSALTGWDETDVSDLVAAFRWDTKVDFKESVALHRLSNCMAALRRLGIGAARAIAWATSEPDFAIAEGMKQTVKAKYDLKQWQEVIKPLQDIFREQKRDALVSWLIARNNPNWLDKNALYSYFLIDMEMSACMLTSRIKQAAAAAQLFVQRCLMNLELDIAVRSERIDTTDTQFDTKWKQWKWMKYYRVWEANRKVFLYPENWIEPELRDDKSPFFKELENELMQNDISRDIAEEAYLNYLEKLDRVANLEIRAMQNHEGEVHVFGRSRSSLAPEYYYRKRNQTGRWAAWEKIDLEINANHLMPAIHNKRLYLLWPQFLEKANAPTSAPVPAQSDDNAPIPQPEKYWEIRLFWSELKKGKWTPKTLSNEYTWVYQMQVGGENLQNIDFRVQTDDFIKIKLYYIPDPSIDAPISFGGFLKQGKQISHYAGNSESIISAPYSQFYNNLIRHNTNSYYFYFSSIEHWSIQPASSNSESIRLLKAIHADRSFTVIDVEAKSFINNGSFFFWDPQRTYYVTYRSQRIDYASHYETSSRTLFECDFEIHYHPFVEIFYKELNIKGITGLLNRRIQINPSGIDGAPPLTDFEQTYWPEHKNFYDPGYYPVEVVDFSPSGSYSIYNWELFFHIPFHIANKLASNQRFEEALEWFHYIFDPTNTDNAVLDPNTPQQKYWITKPFYETTKADYYKQKIENLLLAIAQEEAAAVAQVQEWRNNPFNPHLIARMRTVAYQKSVLIKYIQTLIAWGDQLYRRNTMESINEATQLYILADSVLGPRPKSIPKKVGNPIKNFYQLEQEGIDAFGNALMEVENLLPSLSSSTIMGEENPEMPRLDVLYFCIPNNEKLLTMWDTVADRLFKIRHCMNIEGVVQQLPLFDPSLDPAALVRAVAGGLDLSSALAEMNAPLPLYRFNFMIQRAIELCNEVKSLGTAMLSALEKKDAEAFALLRSSHELVMMDAVRDVKNQQIEEALKNWESLIEGKKITEERKAYYDKLVNDGWNNWEKISFLISSGAIVVEAVATVLNTLSAGASLIPTIKAGAAGVGGSPTVTLEVGGKQVSNSLQQAAAAVSGASRILQMGASLTSTVASYQRRSEEWDFQKRLAEKELPQIDKQIAAALVRWNIANTELRNHDRQKENLEKEFEYMRNKFTSQELYDWMVNQLSTVYFQSYQLAYDIAKRAERCFRYEMGLTDSNYIQFGYWDSLKKGLLSGEKIYHDLKRLETAYYEQNRREYELTKHISLAQLDPVALLKLRQNGECIIDVPETWFDMDYPGHYFRRIKSVSLSIPCIAGPYTTIACTLTLTSNKLRKDSTLLGGNYERDLTIDDPRFRDEIAAIQSIATSSAQNDSGMFELNFRDERYLPFEGAGAIGTWHIKLNKHFPQFDFATISDVILHLNYTAREGGGALKAKALEAFNQKLNTLALAENQQGLFRVYDIKREFSTQWHKFLNSTAPDGDQTLTLDNLHERLPYFTKNFSTKKVSKIELVAMVKDSTKSYKVMVSPFGINPADLLSMSAGTTYQDLHNGFRDLTGSEVDLNTWTFKIQEDGAADFHSLSADAIEELFLIINYAIS
ncbi:MAG: neuraminidase-like domain-containing protein [Haliscomenobacter sp.]|uniref:Tc toxin subunit A-related protein n=1 Tax=Haliscomenobacter sp. TaxID=2717303 RepID=UPI0029BF11EB|nr:neuraminidase-like domain-containing protein [Haliscomenobacter sp.]MDX2072073.1 neuraminidase-like domain-containing protein [Haliscomenobacter sp.]